MANNELASTLLWTTFRKIVFREGSE